MQRKVVSSFRKEGTSKAGKPYVKFDVKFEGDNNTYSGFGEENAVQQGAFVDVETWSKQNGQYTNYSYKLVAPSGNSAPPPQQSYTPAAQQAPSQNPPAASGDALIQAVERLAKAVELSITIDLLKSEGKPYNLDQAVPYITRMREYTNKS